MNRVVFAGLALAATAALMVAPSEAGSVRKPVSEQAISLTGAQQNADTSASCRMKRVVKYDYAGNLYLKKVRVCA
jgi:hypothetical protein